MWIVAGLFFLGLLVGNLVGLISESAVTSLVGLLFALIGGSVVALQEQIDTTAATSRRTVHHHSVNRVLGREPSHTAVVQMHGPADWTRKSV